MFGKAGSSGVTHLFSDLNQKYRQQLRASVPLDVYQEYYWPQVSSSLKKGFFWSLKKSKEDKKHQEDYY